MITKISFEKALWNTSGFGSDKLCVMVEFPNCISTTTGKPFKWMPRYDELQAIRKALDDIEKMSWGGVENQNESKN